MEVVIAFILWAALLYGATGFVKIVGGLIGFGESKFFVRCLPLVPFLIGGPTGIWVLPALAAELAMTDLAALPWGVFLSLGLGAGGLAGTAYKVVHQTILGKDRRLATGLTGIINKGDPAQLRQLMDSDEGKRIILDHISKSRDHLSPTSR